MKKTLWSAFVSMAMACFATPILNCQQAKDVAASSNRDPVIAAVPEKARMKPNPLAQDPDAPIAGHKLFLQHCSECHGIEGIGSYKAPSLRMKSIQQSSPGTIFWVLSNGVVRHGMPDWSNLPDPQRWQIVTYVLSLHRADPTAVKP